MCLEKSMPIFEDSKCQNGEIDGELCVKVEFPNSVKDLLILEQIPGTHIYEGHLRDDSEVNAVLIDVPATKKRMVKSKL